MKRRTLRTQRKSSRRASPFDPRYLRQEVMLATAALVVCLFMAAGVVERVVRDLGSPYVAAVISAVLVDLANQDRAEFALPELKVNPVLVAAAQAKVDDMAAKGYFAHTSPEGFNSWHWFEEAGYEYKYAGENLAVSFSESGDVEKAWMASPTHRDNIVNPKYAEIGIATAVGTYKGKTVIFAVQMFGTPKAEAQARGAQAPLSPALPFAQATSTLSVLGEATAVMEEPVQTDEDPPRLTRSSGEAGGDTAVIVEKENIPWWASLVASPKQTLRYAYYIIGLFILASLFFDMELELHWHHLRHAMKAGILLATMSMLFVVADWVFFAEPILALGKMFGL